MRKKILCSLLQYNGLPTRLFLTRRGYFFLWEKFYTWNIVFFFGWIFNGAHGAHGAPWYRKTLLKYNIDTQNFRIPLKQFRMAYLHTIYRQMEPIVLLHVKYNTYDFEITTAIILLSNSNCWSRGGEEKSCHQKQ